MFTQRMLKDYAMIGLNNRFGNPTADLKKIMGAFENHMESLYQFNKNLNNDIKTKNSIKEAQILWKPIKKVLSEPANKDLVGKLQNDLEALLKVANDATGLFAKQTGKQSGKIINISGRQRMLSQRMAGLYMLKVWGVNDPQFKKKMDGAMALFKKSLEILMNSSLNTPQISSLLRRVKKSFMFFEIMNKTNSRFIPTLIYKKSNEILKDMNTATGLYASQESK